MPESSRSQISSENNPYAPPASSVQIDKARDKGDIDPVAARTRRPAIFLTIIAGVSLLRSLELLVLSQIGVAYGLSGFFTTFVPTDLTGSAIGTAVVRVCTNITTVVGAHHLYTLQNRRIALAGAFIACIPWYGPCLGLSLPFGIWALVLLNKPEVKRAFD